MLSFSQTQDPVSTFLGEGLFPVFRAFRGKRLLDWLLLHFSSLRSLRSLRFDVLLPSTKVFGGYNSAIHDSVLHVSGLAFISGYPERFRGSWFR